MTEQRLDNVAILVRMPKKLRDELTQAATASERSTAALIRLLARQHLDGSKGGRK